MIPRRKYNINSENRIDHFQMKKDEMENESVDSKEKGLFQILLSPQPPQQSSVFATLSLNPQILLKPAKTSNSQNNLEKEEQTPPNQPYNKY